MRITRFKIQYLPATILIVVGVLVLVFMASDAIAWYPATYADSAHGNTDPGYGVNRSGTDYSTGDCANCHDTFDDSICGVNELMLFAPMNPVSQTDNFCFECHCDSGNSEQVATIQNYDYGYTFGMGSGTGYQFDNIKEAFSNGLPLSPVDNGSSHNLQKLRNWVGTKTGGNWMTLDTNACLACHEPHYAQKNQPVQSHVAGGVQTAIIRPDARSSGVKQPNNIYGDEAGNDELMSESGGIVYQAPYYGDTSNPGWEVSYEPAGDATSDGSNLPNFARFCLACHEAGIPVDKTDAYPGTRIVGLKAIAWTYGAIDRHGARPGSPAPIVDCMGAPCGYAGSLKEPYNDPNENYILSCTDCHEPHGSKNAWLLRTIVNGVEVGEFGPLDDRGWYDFCTACHNITPGGSTGCKCGPHHWDAGSPPSGTSGWCYDCHRHTEFGGVPEEGGGL